MVEEDQGEVGRIKPCGHCKGLTLMNREMGHHCGILKRKVALHTVCLKGKLYLEQTVRNPR